MDKVKRKLEGLEAAVESKTALLRELDDDQGSMEDELETLRMQMRKELEEAEMIRKLNKKTTSRKLKQRWMH